MGFLGGSIKTGDCHDDDVDDMDDDFVELMLVPLVNEHLRDNNLPSSFLDCELLSLD